MFANTDGSVAAPPPVCISLMRDGTLAGARHIPPQGNAACQRGDIPSGEGRGYQRASHAPEFACLTAPTASVNGGARTEDASLPSARLRCGAAKRNGEDSAIHPFWQTALFITAFAPWTS
jgi:hypothetical protein